jgi:hypothetical protein
VAGDADGVEPTLAGVSSWVAQYANYWRLSKTDRRKLTALRAEKTTLTRRKGISDLAIAVVESWFCRTLAELSPQERKLREAVRSWQKEVEANQRAIDAMIVKSNR